MKIAEGQLSVKLHFYRKKVRWSEFQNGALQFGRLYDYKSFTAPTAQAVQLQSLLLWL